MERRHFLGKIAAASASLGLIGSVSGEEGNQYAGVRRSTLEYYSWQDVGKPEVPQNLPDEDFEDRSKWEASMYADDHLTPSVREQTKGQIDTQLMSMVTARAPYTGYFAPSSEWGETRVDMDSIGEQVCEGVILASMENLDTHDDYHIKTVQQIVDLSFGQIPWVGDGLSATAGYFWDTPASITTRDGSSPYLAQYLGTKTLQANGEEYEVDYRGLYVDWFTDGEYYGAIAFYPQDREVLKEAVSELVSVDLEFEKEIGLEEEVINMLSAVGG